MAYFRDVFATRKYSLRVMAPAWWKVIADGVVRVATVDDSGCVLSVLRAAARLDAGRVAVFYDGDGRRT